MNEAKLIAGLKKKNTSALEEIIEIYTPYVSTVIRNMLKGYASAEDIEELTADSFVSLWEHSDSITSEHLSGYLSAVARSKARNFMRRNIVITENIDDMVIISDDSTEEEAAVREVTGILKDVISELPDTEREIVLRFYCYGQRCAEIADVMDMNGSTVRTKLARSRKMLRRELEKRGYGYEENELE